MSKKQTSRKVFGGTVSVGDKAIASYTSGAGSNIYEVEILGFTSKKIRVKRVGSSHIELRANRDIRISR